MDTQTMVHTTRPFMSGRSQAVRIPKEYRIQEEEVIINRVGESLMITPVSAAERLFYEALHSFTDDFLDDGRPIEVTNERMDL